MKEFITNHFLNLFLFITAFLAPIKSVMVIVGLCILIDTVMGIVKARKQKQKITSKKLSNVLFKMFVYQAVIVLLFSIEKFILGDFIGLFIDLPFFLTKIGAAVMVFIEGLSIHENYKAITGVSFYQKFKQMIGKVRDFKQDIKDLKEDDSDSMIGASGEFNNDKTHSEK